MPIKVGINGFGRIGRNIVRTAIDDKDIDAIVHYLISIKDAN